MSRPARHATWQHLGPVLLLAALTLTFFAPVVLQGKSFTTIRNYETLVHPWADVLDLRGPVPIQSDQAALSHPWQVDLTRSLDEGAIPFWDANAFVGGYPKYTNGSSGQLYPPRLLAARLLSPIRAHDVLSVLVVFLAGVCAYFFMRELGVGAAGGLLTAIAWMFAEFNTAWLHFEVVAPVQFLLPLGLLVVRRAARIGSPRAAALAGLVLGSTMLAGHVLWLGVTVAVAGIYSVSLAVAGARGRVPALAGRRRSRRAALGVPVVVGIVAALVACVELVPLIPALADSQREPFAYGDLYTYVTAFSSHALSPPSALRHLFWPVAGPLSSESINLQLCFAGTATAALAIVGASTRRPGTALGRWLALGFGLAAIGGPVTWVAYHSNPLLQTLWPYGRLFQWAVFGVAVLGGIGLDVVLLRARRLGRPRLAAVLRVAIAAVVLGATATQGIVAGRDVNPPFARMNTANTFPDTGLVRAIRAHGQRHPWPARVMPLSSGGAVGQSGLLLGPGNHGALIGADLVSGYDSAIPLRTVVVSRFLEGDPRSGLHARQEKAFWILPYDDRVPYEQLARFGVSALATQRERRVDADWGGPARRALRQRTAYTGDDGNLIELGDDDVGPRLVTDADVVDTAEEAFDTFTSADYRWHDRVVVERRDAERLPIPQPGAPGGRRAVRDVVATANRLALTTQSSAAALLVVPQNWDAGWSAEVDGQDVPLIRGNYAQQVVPVPAGTAHVVLHYRPRGFAPSAWISGSAVAGVLLALVPRPRRRRAHRGDDELGEELVGEQPREDPQPDAL